MNFSAVRREQQWVAGLRAFRPEQVLRSATVISVGTAVVAIVLWTAVPGLRGHNVAAVAIVGVMLSVPHGAVDYLLPQSDRWLTRRSARLGMLGAYLLVFSLMLIIIWLLPVAIYFLVPALAVLHWGSGDALFHREDLDRQPGFGGIVEVVARGGVIIAMPEIVQPRQVAQLLDRIAPGVVTEARIPMLLACFAIMAAATGFFVVSLVRRDWLAAGEITLLVAMGGVLPPGVAAGLYLGLWHATRQTARIVADTRRDEGDPAGLAVAGIDQARVLRIMVFGTIATGVLALAVVTLMAVAPGGAARLVSGSSRFATGDWTIVMISALVAPHVATVLRYDRWKIRRGNVLMKHQEPAT